MYKCQYYHAGEVVYVIETFIIFIRDRLIARERFGAVRASAVNFSDV
jgi:hypothetical protein